MNNHILTSVITASLLFSGNAFSSSFTSTSSSSFDVTTVGASTIGGIVADLKGLNGAHVVSQLSASSLFSGYASTNPLTIGTQNGFTSSTLSALGGGLSSASFRFTLWDGDTASGEFDYNNNDLLINGLNFGNWSNVTAENTDSLGTTLSSGLSTGGFRDNKLDTGWFSSLDSTLLGQLFTSLSSGSMLFQLDDVSFGDNYLDFTQGIDNSLINVGQGPTVTPPTNSTVPEPTSLALLGLGLAAFKLSRKSKKA